MKGLPYLIGAMTAALSLTVGLNSASASNHSANGTKVAVAGTGLGRALVDGRGHTLYLFAHDKHGKSTCAGRCAAFWPPLIASGKPLAAAGAKAALLGTTKRADGRLQVTYDHHPLYTFVKDTKKGQTNGEELDVFGAEWYALSPAGARLVKSGAGSSGTGYPAPGGYGSGGYR